MMRFALLLLVACGPKPGTTTTTTGGTGATGDKTAGLAAFETVRTVLQHPRCQNCHPAGDRPLVGDDSHLHPQNVQRGPDGHGMVGEQCTTCHGPNNPPNAYGTHIPPGIASGWRMPPPDQPLVFVGKSAHDLCEQVKDPARNGGKDMAKLRTHLDDPLVAWGWNPGFGRAPVPIARDKFLAAWETWAGAGAPSP